LLFNKITIANIVTATHCFLQLQYNSIIKILVLQKNAKCCVKYKQRIIFNQKNWKFVTIAKLNGTTRLNADW